MRQTHTVFSSAKNAVDASACMCVCVRCGAIIWQKIYYENVFNFQTIFAGNFIYLLSKLFVDQPTVNLIVFNCARMKRYEGVWRWWLRLRDFTVVCVFVCEFVRILATR